MKAKTERKRNEPDRKRKKGDWEIRKEEREHW